jgi:hypothetical protein
LSICYRIASLPELVDQKAEPLLVFRYEIIVIRLLEGTAYTNHVGNLLLVMVLEGNILVGQNMS